MHPISEGQPGRPSPAGTSLFELPDLDGPERSGRAHFFLGSWFALACWLTCALYFSGASHRLPSGVSLGLAGFAFCLAPGMALYSLLALRRGSHFSILTLLVLSCSLGFTFNFLANVVIYLFNPSVSRAVSWYLTIVAGLYLFLLACWHRRGEALFGRPTGIASRRFLLLVVAVVVVGVVLFYKMPPGYYVEELMVLRKLADNSGISPNNIAFQLGEHTTYFFVPFYLLIAMASRFAGVDVLTAVPGLWPLTAGISLLCLVAVCRVLYRHQATIASIVAMTAMYAVGFMQPISNLATALTPFPDRYALGVGVLIPLALFHFLVHMAEKQINVPAFVGLVYLIVEITFIHARETLFFLAVLLMAGALLLVDARRNRGDLVRLATLLAIVGVILLAYRQLNLTFQPELGVYVARLKQELLEALVAGWNQYGVGGLFGIPQFHGERLDPFPYAERVLPVVTGGLDFVLLVVWCLPICALAADRVSALLAPLAIAGFGLFSLFQGLRLAIGYLVGAPFIFDVFSVMFLLAAVVFADMARMIAALVVGTWTASARDNRQRALLFSFLGVAAVRAVAASGSPGFSTGSPYAEMAIYLLTVLAVFLRAAQLRGGARQGAERAHPEGGARGPQTSVLARIAGRPSALVAKCMALSDPRRILVAAVCIVAVTMSGSLLKAAGRADAPAGEVLQYRSRQQPTGILGEDYRRLSREKLFSISTAHSYDLPPDLTRYIRQAIPEGRVWFGAHTLPVLLVSNQYAPIITNGGSLNAGFEVNNVFLHKYGGENGRGRMVARDVYYEAFLCKWLETGESAARLAKALDDFRVEWIITIPAEQPCAARLVADPLFRGAISKAYESEGFGLFRIDQPAQRS